MIEKYVYDVNKILFEKKKSYIQTLKIVCIRILKIVFRNNQLSLNLK